MEIIFKIPFEMSFAIHKKAHCWSDKNLLKPDNVFRNANTKFLFNCDKCNHEINTNLIRQTYFLSLLQSKKV